MAQLAAEAEERAAAAEDRLAVCLAELQQQADRGSWQGRHREPQQFPESQSTSPRHAEHLALQVGQAKQLGL